MLRLLRPLSSSFRHSSSSSRRGFNVSRIITSMPEGAFNFFALGDFGTPSEELHKVAAAMQRYSMEMHISPAFVIGLGDNFYPCGVLSSESKMFQSHWRDVFLCHEALRVPWYMLLGNHDYFGNPMAQIEFTTHANNIDQIWQMPSNHYKITPNLSLKNENGKDLKLIEFFALDTNGCQGHVRRSHPETVEDLQKQIVWLDNEMKSSDAHWKFVLGHHPLYNKGKEHSIPASCLRDPTYGDIKRQIAESQGFGLENVLSDYDRVIYLSGHEHVFQHHKAKGVQHVICGNTGADIREGEGFYGGVNDDVTIDWYDETNTYGFVAVNVTAESVSINFINSEAQSFHQVIVDSEQFTYM